MNREIEEYLHKTNPWWHGLDFKTHIGIWRYSYVEKIHRSFSIREMKVLYGIRRCGKSTILYQLIKTLLEQGTPQKNIAFINFENNLFSPYLNTPGFLDDLFETIKRINLPKGPLFLFLDEIQEVPLWEKWANKIYEQKLDIQLVLTGSSSTLQSTELATLLTGRNLSFEIKPLNFQEYLFFKTGSPVEKKDYYDMLDKKTELTHYFENYLQEGGFPGIVLTQDPELKEALLRQYFQDILYRDLIRKYEIRQPLKLENLAIYLVSNIGRALSYRSMANTMGIAIDTLKEYLSYFEKAGLFSFLPPFTFSLKSKLRDTHPNKIYVTEHGLRNVAALNYDRDEGFIVENITFQKIKNEKLLGYIDKPPIDFAFHKKGLYLLQVSYTDSLHPREQESLEKAPLKSENKIIVSKNVFENTEKIKTIPAWYYLL